MSFPAQFKYALGVLLWLAVGVFFWQTSRPGHDWGGDFSVYMWQAGNFAAGRPYTESSFQVTPRSERNHPAVYPPLTSLVMSPFYTALGLDYQAWKRLLVVPFWLSLPVWLLIARRLGVEFWPAVVALLVFAASAVVFWVRDNVGSETLYQLVSGLALLLILEGQARHWDTRRVYGFGAAVALLLLLCYASRASALALAVGLVFAEIVRHRRITRFVWVTGLCFAAGLLVYNRWIFSAGGQYGKQFVFLPAVYVSNFLYYVRSHASMWQGSPAAPRYLLSFGLLLLAGWVLIRRWRQPTVLEGYLLVSYGLMTVYSLTQNARYLIGVFPLVLFYGALGLQDPIWRRFSPGLARALPPAAATLALVTVALSWRTLDLAPAPVGVEQASFPPVCEFLRREGGTVLSWNPRLLAFYTGRPSAIYADPGELAAQVQALPGRLHLLFYQHELDRAELTPYLEQHAGDWSVAFENTDFRVYRRREPAP